MLPRANSSSRIEGPRATHPSTRSPRISSPSIALYRFRTLRGEVLVVLEGAIDESTLVYSGSVKVSNEGDIILF